MPKSLRLLLLALVGALVAGPAGAAAPSKKAAPAAKTPAPAAQPKIVPPPIPPSTEDLLFADPAAAKWAPHSFLPKGAQAGLIGADPVTTGATGYLKLPAGYKLPQHTHQHTATYVLVSGKLAFTHAKTKRALSPGAVVVMPPRAVHALSCEAGSECLLILRHHGPADIAFK